MFCTSWAVWTELALWERQLQKNDKQSPERRAGVGCGQGLASHLCSALVWLSEKRREGWASLGSVSPEFSVLLLSLANKGTQWLFQVKPTHNGLRPANPAAPRISQVRPGQACLHFNALTSSLSGSIH